MSDKPHTIHDVMQMLSERDARIRALEAEVGRRVRQIEATYHVQRKLKERVEAVEYKYYDMLKHCFALADELDEGAIFRVGSEIANRMREIAEGREENPEWPDDWPDKETVDRLTRDEEGREEGRE